MDICSLLFLDINRSLANTFRTAGFLTIKDIIILKERNAPRKRLQTVLEINNISLDDFDIVYDAAVKFLEKNKDPNPYKHKINKEDFKYLKFEYDPSKTDNNKKNQNKMICNKCISHIVSNKEQGQRDMW